MPVPIVERLSRDAPRPARASSSRSGRRAAARSGAPRARTSSGCTTSTASPTACSTSTRGRSSRRRERRAVAAVVRSQPRRPAAGARRSATPTSTPASRPDAELPPPSAADARRPGSARSSAGSGTTRRSTASAGSSRGSSPSSCCPLYTRYLTPSDYGKIETLLALTTVMGLDAPCRDHERVLPLLLRRRGRRRAACACSARRSGSRWAAATLGLRAPARPAPTRSRRSCSARADAANLVRAAGVALWATVNYEQLTALFRVEERSVAFVVREPRERLPHDRRDAARSSSGSTRARSASSSATSRGTLIVYLALLGYRREQLGLQFDRGLLREMNRFGHPARPDRALPLGDELQRPLLPRQARRRGRGRPLLGRRAHRLGDGAAADRVPHGVARVRVLDRATNARRAGRTPTSSRTSTLVTAWVAPALTLLSPVDRRAARGADVRRVVARRRPARVRDGRVRRVHRRRDRRRARAADAVQLGRDRAAAAVEHRAQPRPDPAATG